MRAAVFATAAIVALHPALGSEVDAQVVGGCSSFGTAVRTAGGAFVGGWVGFVAAKMKLSDWNDDSRSPSAVRQRNQITIGGAVLGAVAANLMFRRPCRVARGAVIAGTPRESAGRRSITAAEIEKSGMSGTVYDLVYALRRSWLNTRGVSSMSEAPHYVQDESGKDVLVPGEPELMIYVDEMKLGSLSQLRQLPIAGVVEVRYYDPSQATLKWGAGHSRGAIQVISVGDPARSLRPQPMRLVAPFSLRQVTPG